MQLEPFVDEVRKDLGSVSEPRDSGVAEIVGRIATALEASVRLRLLEAVSQAALELGAQIPSGRVETRLVGTDPVLTLVEETSPGGLGGQADAPPARLTVRLPGRLKTAVERAAGGFP